MAPRHVGLGVSLDLSCAHTALVVHAAPTAERVSKVLAYLHECASLDYLPPSGASSARGKLGFVFGTSYFRFGRAALQPLLQREYFDRDFSFGSALRDMLAFLDFVLPRLRPLAMPLFRDPTPPLVVYTDAMYVPCGVEGLPLLRIGFVVCCPVRGVTVHSHCELPQEYFRAFRPCQKTYIMQGEGVGAVAALFSVPELFRGRSVRLLLCSMTTLVPCRL